MVLESLIAVMSGGATGLLGSLISDVTGYFKGKSEQKHEIALKELDIKVLEAETKASIKVAESEMERTAQEAAARINEAELGAFIQAQRSDADVIEALGTLKETSKLLNVAAFIRTMIRPTLTIYLCVVSTMMYVDARNSLERVDLKEVSAQTLKVYGDTSGNVLYLTSAAVMFWFGQRKKPTK